MKRNSVFIFLLAALLWSIFLTPVYGMTNNKDDMSGISEGIGGLATTNNSLITEDIIVGNPVSPETSNPVTADVTSTTKDNKSDHQESIVITMAASFFSGLVVALLTLLAQKREKQREILLKNAYEWYKQIKTEFLSRDFLRQYFNDEDRDEKFKKEYETSASKWEDAELTLRTNYCCNKILDNITPKEMLQSCLRNGVKETQEQVKTYVRNQYKKLLKSIMR